MRKEYIPFFVFFAFWFLQIINGIDVIVRSVTNPFAAPIYAYAWWVLALNGEINHPYFWYYLLYGFQFSGALPYQAWELIIVVFVVEAPILIAYGLYIIKTIQKK